MKNRTKKVIAVIAIFVLIIGAIVVSSLNGSLRGPMFDSLTDVFFHSLVETYGRDAIVVHSADAYFKDDWHYYHAAISYFDPKQEIWTDKDLVYYGQTFLSSSRQLDLNATLTGSDANYANAYREAVQQGVHKAFTAQEIEDLLDLNTFGPLFKEMTKDFFAALLNNYERDAVVVRSVDAYKNNGLYYYHAVISCLDSTQGIWTDKDMLCHDRGINDRQILDLNANLTGDDATYANAYREAVQQGEHKAFTAQEIKDCVAAFYNSAE